MNSASGSKACGSILILSLVLISILSTLSLAGLARTGNQSQLAAVLAHQAVLQAEARRALTIAAHRAAIAGSRHAGPPVPGCPERCDWKQARPIYTDTNIDAAYIVQRLAPETRRFLISVRATQQAGGEFILHGLLDADAGRFRFIL